MCFLQRVNFTLTCGHKLEPRAVRVWAEPWQRWIMMKNWTLWHKTGCFGEKEKRICTVSKYLWSFYVCFAAGRWYGGFWEAFLCKQLLPWLKITPRQAKQWSCVSNELKLIQSSEQSCRFSSVVFIWDFVILKIQVHRVVTGPAMQTWGHVQIQCYHHYRRKPDSKTGSERSVWPHLNELLLPVLRFSLRLGLGAV